MLWLLSTGQVAHGPLTLLFTTVLLCLAVLGVLSLATARADLARARRSLEHLATEAAAEQAGQAWLAAVDAAGRAGAPLPEATTLTADGAAAELPLENGATLRLAAAPGEGGWRFTRWQLDAPWQPDTSLDVWDGL